MEARMAAEVGSGAAVERITRGDANDLALTLLKTYEENIKDAPLGKNFRECYNVQKVKPTDEYLTLYRKIRKELEDIGVPFIY